ncbi:uracil permease [Pochonia chlamydosporia 170]|uniref:Uracil permease n=1 Tax=Pochonia chlamydosporia 170 TaxID=1380566 RepID=A0A179F1Z0_METCM|nr:uracil permease [Pochonia chlamydosporia 170]OAQ59133.1 uracil permease [Pochonia chlamydosporia 170]
MDQTAKKSLKERLQCPKDDDPNYDNTTWCNRDLIPIPPERRTYGFVSYMAYWTVSGSNISAWTVGSTLLAFGLTPQQAIAAVVVGGIITGLLAVACGWMGAKHYIGYTVSSRFSWGMRGSYFPVILRVFIASMWFGMQAFWGGQATRVCIGAIIPGLAHLPNSFSASSHLETKDFIGLIIWMCAFIPAVLIRPERLQIPFAVCFVLFCLTAFGLLIWSVSQAHGPGAMFHQPGTAPNVGWAFMFSLTAIMGAWGGGTLGQSDWTRYATKQMAPVPSQLIASPLTITVTAVIGIVVTSASRDILGGELIWNPIYLLAAMQEYYGSNSGVRAGVFFGGLGLVASQLAISVVLNAMSCGMDMAGLWPKYINIRRGAAIMAVIGIAIQPWQLLATAAKFLQVLSGFGVFLAPLTGIMLADYHIIRRRKLKVNDLYCGDSSSIYWYHGGFNWRAPVAFIMGAWPMLPGLVASVNASTDASWVGWIRLYNLTFIIGLAIAFAVFLGLNLAIPPPGLGEEGEFEPINHSRAPSSDGAGDARFGSQDGQHEKTAPVYAV